MSNQKEIVAPRAAVGSVSKSRKTSMERRSFLAGLLSAGLVLPQQPEDFLQLSLGIFFQMCFLSRLNLLK